MMEEEGDDGGGEMIEGEVVMGRVGMMGGRCWRGG